jgi:protein involved in polysaccharide export with SLBB domain
MTQASLANLTKPISPRQDIIALVKEDAMPPTRFPKFRFTLKSLLVLILGIAIGFSLNLQTLKLLTGRSRYASLPQYVIEPPDVLRVHIVGDDSGHRISTTSSHLVGPDGRINLNEWGTLYVAGMTIERTQAAIEMAVAKTLKSPHVFVDIQSYNSKRYYVITQPPNAPSTVTEFPITGNDTVLDAIAQLGRIPSGGLTQISVTRPAPNGVGSASTFVVNWGELASGKSDATNYQLQPGDRVVISQQPVATAAN